MEGITLEKKITFHGESPVRPALVSVSHYPKHWHRDLQIVYVLEGIIQLDVSFANYILSPGDIHIVNINDMHSLSKKSEHNKILIVSLDSQFFRKIYPDLASRIFISYQNTQDRGGMESRSRLANLLQSASFLSEPAEAARAGEDILSLLYEEFQFFSVSHSEKVFKLNQPYPMDKSQLERINRIIIDIYANYNKKIRLTALSAKMHINKYYLSHLIKAETGENFQNFVNMVRTEMSEQALLSTDKSITEIALESGFSNAQYYNNHFLKWFGLSPREYRKAYKEKTIAFALPQYEILSLSLLAGGAAKKDGAKESSDDRQEILISLPKNYEGQDVCLRITGLHETHDVCLTIKLDLPK